VNDKHTLTEAEARQILANTASHAANPDLFSARRGDGGWVFAWADSTRPIPMGVRSEVVTDSGQVGRVKIGETGEQALQRLAD
jgi:hypothetical protein